MTDWCVHVPACVIPSAPHFTWSPRIAIDLYFGRHILRADALARALAAKSGVPDGWRWEATREWKHGEGEEAWTSKEELHFRAPPLPYRDQRYRKPGQCQLCGQPIFRLGWHTDFACDGKTNERASWHACCVKAFRFWTAPSNHASELIRRQNGVCAITEADLEHRDQPTPQIDHAIPLYRVWREREAQRWPEVLRFWAYPNLQVITAAAHRRKCADEARERASFNARPQGTPLFDERVAE